MKKEELNARDLVEASRHIANLLDSGKSVIVKENRLNKRKNRLEFIDDRFRI